MRITEARDLIEHYDKIKELQASLDSYIKQLQQSKKFEDDLEKLELAAKEFWKISYKYHFGAYPEVQRVE